MISAAKKKGSIPIVKIVKETLYPFSKDVLKSENSFKKMSKVFGHSAGLKKRSLRSKRIQKLTQIFNRIALKPDSNLYKISIEKRLKKSLNKELDVSKNQISKKTKKPLEKNYRKIVLSSNSDKVLISYWQSLKKKIKGLRSSYIFFYLPSTKKRITLLKSPHVNKKAKEQFELITYKMVILLSKELEISTIKNFFVKKPACVFFKVIFNDIVQQIKNKK